jgi:hypothetical protein
MIDELTSAPARAALMAGAAFAGATGWDCDVDATAAARGGFLRSRDSW